MKIDNLVPVFARAYWRCPMQDCEEAYEVGVRAVVEALRDEFREEYGMWERFSQILGDAGEKVAEYTGGMNDLSVTPATDAAPAHEWFQFSNLVACKACGVVRRADDKNNPCKGPVRVALRDTDPAPAVCEWTPQDEGPAHEIWKTGCGTMYERAKSTGWCNKCKAPIKFTEAK